MHKVISEDDAMLASGSNVANWEEFDSCSSEGCGGHY